MANTKAQQKEVFSQIASINTLLERYPVLTTTDPMLNSFSINTSIGFLLSLLEIFGVSQADIVNWICKMVGDKDDGLLMVIEHAIKALLLANVKGMFTCSFNPILPDNLMRYVIDDGSGRQDPSADDPDKKNCIEINLQAIDLFGLLANCPSNEKGGVFYFDAFDPSGVTVVGDKEIAVPNYTPGDLYKSRDFNAFLWYVINKGNIGSPTDKQKNTWDNRNRVYKKFEDDETKDNFFAKVDAEYANYPKIPIKNKDEQVVLDKEQYIICQYAEHGSSQAYSNVLRVWLNADRYYRARKFSAPVGKDSQGQPIYHEFAINKTIFEFNFDYIYSLKLFDTKTLLANIVNSMLGLASSLSVSFSFEQKQMQKKVEAIIDKMMMQDDTEITEDCYYKFDNTMYQQMIDEVTRSYKGSYVSPLSTYNENYDDVYSALSSLGNEAAKAGQSQQKELLTQVLEATAKKLDEDKNIGISGGVDINYGFTLGADFITNFIKQMVVQIVLQILSPKVGILYAINSQIMGEAGDLTDWENFIKSFDNLIKNIISSVKDIIVKELYKFMMEQLKPILELLISKLALETIKYYKELIMNLIMNCIPMIGFDARNTTIDNVNYADIIANTGGEAVQTKPEDPC